MSIFNKEQSYQGRPGEGTQRKFLYSMNGNATKLVS